MSKEMPWPEKKFDALSKQDDTTQEKDLILERVERLSPEDKALKLYALLMSLRRKRIEQRKRGEGPPQPKVDSSVSTDDDIASIQELFGHADDVVQRTFNYLWQDENVRNLFLQGYRMIRREVDTVLKSPEYEDLKKTEQEIEEMDVALQRVVRILVLHKYQGEQEEVGYREMAESLGDKIDKLIKDKNEKLAEVKNKEVLIRDDTDILAFLSYEEFRKYHRQGKNNFVKLPTRTKIHREVLRRLANKRLPVLVGETGSGKSEQAVAVAREITGHEALTIQCTENTSEYDLIGMKDSENGDSYMKYGLLMQAITGYTDSRQTEPAVKVGRICRFDEFNLLGDAPYAIIKRLGQIKPGDDFYGKPVLPGAGVILTMNPVGPRYQAGRREIDAAASREYGFVEVSYLEMSEENPEMYKFMLQALMNDNGLISVDMRECAPYYHSGEKPEEGNDEIEIDGKRYRIISLPDNLDQDPTALDDDARALHGVLWRLSYALRDIQNAFVNGNLPDDALANPDSPRFIEANGVMQITKDGSGDLLTLDKGIITAGDIASWLKNFQDRHISRDPDLHTETLAQWIKMEAEAHLESLLAENKINHADVNAIRAIFDHYYLLDENKFKNLDGAKHIVSYIEMGYWSPDVPRPAEVELIEDSNEENQPENTGEDDTGESKVFETEKVTLVDGDFVNIIKKPVISEAEDGEKREFLALGQTKRIPMYTKEGMRSLLARYEGMIAEGELKGKPVFSMADEGYEMYIILNVDSGDMSSLEDFGTVISSSARFDFFVNKALSQAEQRICNENTPNPGGSSSGASSQVV